MAGMFNRLQDEIEARDSGEGLSPIDLLDMPEATATVINNIIRKNGMRLTDIAADLEQSLEETRVVLDELVTKGYVRQIEVKNEIWYKAQFGRKADKVLSLGIWSSLDDIMGETE